MGKLNVRADRGALFAQENLEVFAKTARPGLKKPLSSLFYYPIKDFPSRSGYFEAWICPYFNQLNAYRKRRDKTED